MPMERKYISRRVSYDQECRVVSMYKNERAIKDISRSVGIGRKTVQKILDAHGIRRPYKPAEAKRAIHRDDTSGTIIQQCVSGMSESHKLLNKLFRPSKLA